MKMVPLFFFFFSLFPLVFALVFPPVFLRFFPSHRCSVLDCRERAILRASLGRLPCSRLGWFWFGLFFFLFLTPFFSLLFFSFPTYVWWIICIEYIMANRYFCSRADAWPVTRRCTSAQSPAVRCLRWHEIRLHTLAGLGPAYTYHSHTDMSWKILGCMDPDECGWNRGLGKPRHRLSLGRASAVRMSRSVARIVELNSAGSMAVAHAGEANQWQQLLPHSIFSARSSQATPTLVQPRPRSKLNQMRFN